MLDQQKSSVTVWYHWLAPTWGTTVQPDSSCLVTTRVTESTALQCQKSSNRRWKSRKYHRKKRKSSFVHVAVINEIVGWSPPTTTSLTTDASSVVSSWEPKVTKTFACTVYKEGQPKLSAPASPPVIPLRPPLLTATQVCKNRKCPHKRCVWKKRKLVLRQCI